MKNFIYILFSILIFSCNDNSKDSSELSEKNIKTETTKSKKAFTNKVNAFYSNYFYPSLKTNRVHNVR
jgi:hypothetical protein